MPWNIFIKLFNLLISLGNALRIENAVHKCLTFSILGAYFRDFKV